MKAVKCYDVSRLFFSPEHLDVYYIFRSFTSLLFLANLLAGRQENERGGGGKGLNAC